jgi:microsomal dipeptidase-like Zn-dependent dipeptidase
MENGIVGLNSYSDFHKIEERLIFLGYSKEIVDGIMQTNAQSFLRNDKTSPND